VNPRFIAGFVVAIMGLPLKGELLATKPVNVCELECSIYTQHHFIVPFWRFLALASCWTRALLSSLKGCLDIGATAAIADDFVAFRHVVALTSSD